MKNVVRNAKGQFVSLKNQTVASIETPTEVKPKAEKVKKEKAPKEPKAPKTPKAKGPVVTFEKATYGSAEKQIDVTKKIVLGRKITNKLVGEDPHPKVKKTLSVVAIVDGNKIEKVFNEGDKLIF